MIHYNIWFDLKNDAEQATALSIIQEFLDGLYAAGSIAGFQILKNSGNASKTRMLDYQALIEFSDDAQFSSAFSAQAARGIHTGLHGQVMSLVGEFRIEVFRQIATVADSAETRSSSQTASEI